MPQPLPAHPPGVPVPRPPDDGGAAHEIGLWHKSPETGIAGIVAVVAHHEIVARRHLPVTVADGKFLAQHRVPHVEQALLVEPGHVGLAAGHEIGALAQLPERHLVAVDVETVVLVEDVIARQPDDPLDVVLAAILGVVEHHHVAAPGRMREELQIGERDADAIGIAQHEDVVPHLQRRHHAGGRNLERRHHETANHHRDQRDDQHRLQPFAPRRLALVAHPSLPVIPNCCPAACLCAAARPYSSPSLSTARNASCGTSTLPMAFMRFLPAFCFSRSLRLRVMSPP